MDSLIWGIEKNMYCIDTVVKASESIFALTCLVLVENLPIRLLHPGDIGDERWHLLLQFQSNLRRSIAINYFWGSSAVSCISG